MLKHSLPFPNKKYAIKTYKTNLRKSTYMHMHANNYNLYIFARLYMRNKIVYAK